MKISRIENLDLLRAFAVLLIIYYHSFQMIFGVHIQNKAIYNLGEFGVNVFFVLSGFLITNIYLKHRPVNPFKFWLNRFLRIYPPYLLMVLISWLAVYAIRAEPIDWSYLWMTQNFKDRMPFFLVSWSLCVEEHFYILFSLIIFTIKDLKAQKIVWFAIILIAIFLRYIFRLQGHENFGLLTTGSFFQMDSIAIGVLSAFYIDQQISDKRKPKTINIILSLFLFLITAYLICRLKGTVTYVWGYSVLSGITALKLVSLYQKNALKIAKMSLVKWIAKMAFSIYLVHPLCIHFCLSVFSYFKLNNIFALYFFVLFTVTTCAVIFYHYVEKPSLKFRNRLLSYA